MPLFSDHITNMYYSGSPSYTSSPYSYSSAVSPYGSSYSASYLSPGGNYSAHSSFGGYSRPPLSSRWLTSGGRTYSPMLSTISEKGISSPVRLNSPRRIPISSRSYVSSPYTSRPININTADIDVSRDKYHDRVQSSNSISSAISPKQENTVVNRENGHDKPDIGIDKSPGLQRSTIKRDRTVVRLHTVKRKERDSPRKAVEVQYNGNNKYLPTTDVVEKQTESKKWREKLADDLAYKNQKEKKTLGAKLVEKFTLKERVEDEYDNTKRKSPNNSINEEKSPTNLKNVEITSHPNKSFDRRCSMELLAEQASLFDSLIRRENLSNTPLDLSKIGSEDVTTDMEPKKRKISNQENRLTTTKSDHSLHDHFSSKGKRDPVFPKRKSIRKCSSSGTINKLDSIKELPKKIGALSIPPQEDVKLLKKSKNIKPKTKTRITSTVEVSTPTPQLKFVVENVTVEEKLKPCKKDIIFSSTIDEHPPDIEISTEPKILKDLSKLQWDNTDNQEVPHEIIKDKKLSNEDVEITKSHRKSVKSKGKVKPQTKLQNTNNLSSPEPDDGNFWEKIGKRETIYLIKRKQNIDAAKEQGNQTLSWCSEVEEFASDIKEESNVDKGTKSSEETTGKDIVDTVNETNKNIKIRKLENDCKKINIYPNMSEEKTNIIHEKPTVSFGTMNKNDANTIMINSDVSYTELKDGSAIAENILTTLNQAPSEKAKSEIAMRYTNENKNSDKERRTLDKSSPLDNPHIKFSDSMESNLKSIIESNRIDNSLEDLENENIIKNNKKVNVDKQLKSKEEKNTCHNISFMQVNLLSHLEEIPQSTFNKNDLYNLNTSQFDTMEAPTNKNESKNCSACRETELNSKNKTKDESENYVSAITAENNNTPSVIDIVNSVDNSNIPSHKIIESINPESKNIDQTSALSLSPEDESYISKNTNKEKKKENTTETTEKISKVDNYNITDKQDNKTQRGEKSTVIQSNIPNITEIKKTGPEEENIDIRISSLKKIENKLDPVTSDNILKVFANVKAPKEQKALKPLIATPRPLQKRKPQSIRSSSSSSSESSDDDSSDTETEDDDDKDEGESGCSHNSTEFVECENHPDGRTSTGSNDSGFDSSAPNSPSGFLHAKKDCDVNCHRKCEKLTANLCGVNQRLLVEALASGSTSKRGADIPSTSTASASPQTFNHDILEQELEHSTAYDLFRKTGRFTPPARSIPRFRKYTIEDFQFIRVLGKGSFGKVMLAELRDTEYYYAVKCLKKDVVLEDDDVECTLIERKVLALGTNHPYLCHLFATFQTDSHLFFVMEYLNGGDLMFHIQQSGRFPEVRARFYAAEIVSGLKFLHKRGIVYRDLKLDNILLDFDGHVRIADFGMCKLQIYLDKTADTFCGTPDYMAPEIIKGLKYNQTVDWWSFGVLLYEMLIGQSPFSGCDEDELFWSICNEMPSYPRFLSQESLCMLTRLLDKDARTRLGGPECMHGDIRDQEFFKPIQWDRLERRELDAPFKPRVRHPMDTQYFDRAFTGERPRLTAVEPQVLRSMDQEPFRGFSYTNPNATDR